MLTTLVAGRLGVRIPTNNSRVLSPPASYMGLACQDGYIALRCKNFELYDNLRKIIKLFIGNILRTLIHTNPPQDVQNAELVIDYALQMAVYTLRTTV
jgi:hypothetical protein